MKSTNKVKLAVEKLNLLSSSDDFEHAHSQADQILLDLIDNPEINEAYGNITRWYA